MFTADIPQFFSEAEFAESITLDGVAVSAIFDNGYALGAVGQVGMASYQPSIALATSAVPASAAGKAAVVRGVSYLVAVHEPDGMGLSKLLLERAI